MKLTKCRNGHFYDAEKFSTCPRCMGNAGIGVNDNSVTAGGMRGRNIEPEDDEATVPIWFENPDDFLKEDAAPTVSTVSTKQNLNHVQAVAADRKRVVGWLVCTEGRYRGQSFNLYHGKNYIGRNSDMDICLKNDPSVSRNRHAIICYDSKERIFYAQPGESRELFYVNDSVVLSDVQLKDKDRISVGEATLVFVPFCSADFTW